MALAVGAPLWDRFGPRWASKAGGMLMSHCSTKCAIFLMSLKSLLETGRGAPSPNDVKISNCH